MPTGQYFSLLQRLLYSVTDDVIVFQIAENAGVDASVVVNKVIEANEESIGYDALNDKFVDMIEAGIIDPTKVRKERHVCQVQVLDLPPSLAQTIHSRSDCSWRKNKFKEEGTKMWLVHLKRPRNSNLLHVSRTSRLVAPALTWTPSL